MERRHIYWLAGAIVAGIALIAFATTYPINDDGDTLLLKHERVAPAVNPHNR